MACLRARLFSIRSLRRQVNESFGIWPQSVPGSWFIDDLAPVGGDLVNDSVGAHRCTNFNASRCAVELADGATCSVLVYADGPHGSEGEHGEGGGDEGFGVLMPSPPQWVSRAG